MAASAKGRTVAAPEGASARKPARAAAKSGFARRVIAWQRKHGRHDLPWQNTRDPYRIWVSEIMLQQTQVGAVLAYYARFLGRFPDVEALATADAGEVMRLWSGLGYYSRARNLHLAARMVATEFGGRFPRSCEALRALPGVGRSTAAAIAAFAFGERAAILDGNVKRVLARHFGIDGYPGSALVEARLWALAEALLPAADVEAYTQGLMDLGATVCARGRPRCDACPLASTCVAIAEGRTGELPHRRERKALPRRSCYLLLLVHEDRVLLERRPPAGIWGGLLCPPQAEDALAAQALAKALCGNWGARVELPPIEHGFTHFHLTIHPVLVGLAARGASLRLRDADDVWMTPASALAAGVPAPVKRLLDELRGRVAARPAARAAAVTSVLAGQGIDG